MSALGRDCCYRDVEKLSDDVDALQRDKVALQQQLSDSVLQQHEAMQRALKLAKHNQKLESDLHEMESVALQVESEANRKFAACAEYRTKFQVFVKMSQMFIFNHYKYLCIATHWSGGGRSIKPKGRTRHGKR